MTDNNGLECPFCSRQLMPPQEIVTKFSSTFTGWECECNAVYVYEESGHNLGDAYVDALGFLCGGDLDKALSLMPDIDYEVMEMTIDRRRNKLSDRGRRTGPTYIFIRLIKEQLNADNKR